MSCDPVTTFGQKLDGTIVVMVTDGRPQALTFDQTCEIMISKGVFNAVMGDGGGSSTMVINEKMVNTNENRSVVDALCFYSYADKYVETKEISDALMEDEMYTVVLDAGHGIATSGKCTPAYADGKIIHEAEQNYPIMFKLKEKLEYNGINVIVTNENINFDMSLSSRVVVEKASNANLFVSIHKNADTTYAWTDARGTESYVYALGGNAEKYANIIHPILIETTGDKDRGVKVANFQVLRETKAPAILLELGFMTNKEDAADMLSDSSQECYATAIAKGICKCFDITYKVPVVVDNTNDAISALVTRLKAHSSDLELIADELFKLI